MKIATARSGPLGMVLMAGCLALSGLGSGPAQAGARAHELAVSVPAPERSSSAAKSHRAVVIVSGLATQSPYTTTSQACQQGLAAGNSDTALRASLIAAGNRVYTAPVQSGPGQVISASGFGESADCPPPLPARMTVNSTRPIDPGGRKLAAFLRYLHTEFHINAVDLVGHSMGGLFARSAIKVLKISYSPIKIHSLTTIGTPWTGVYAADYAEGKLALVECGGQAKCLEVLPAYQKLSQAEGPQGAAAAVSRNAMQGPKGWNRQQGDALAGIPVTLIGGNYFTLTGGMPRVWPNDGLVARDSALAKGIPDHILGRRVCITRPDVHMITFAEELNLAWTSALTWDPVVLNAVNVAVKQGAAAKRVPNRHGCP